MWVWRSTLIFPELGSRTGGSGVQSLSQLHREFEASFCYTKPFLKTDLETKPKNVYLEEFGWNVKKWYRKNAIEHCFSDCAYMRLHDGSLVCIVRMSLCVCLHDVSGWHICATAWKEVRGWLYAVCSVNNPYEFNKIIKLEPSCMESTWVNAM